MSVQTSYNLYQSAKGVGVIGENNPYDIGAFIVGDSPAPVQWGVFVVREAAGSKDIVSPSSTGAKLVGATTKQEDRVQGQFGGISPDTTSNEDLVFTLSKGRPASIMRMGYLNVLSTVSTWQAGGDVFVKVKKGASSDDGHPLGSVSTSESTTATTGLYEKLGTAVFADSSVSGEKVAKVYFDLRVPQVTTVAGGE